MYLLNEEVNKFALSSSNNKRIQTINSIETCIQKEQKFNMQKCKNEKSKCNDTIRQCKKRLTLRLKKKTQKNAILISPKFLIINAEN